MEYKYDRSRHFEIPKYFYFEAKNSTVGGRNNFNYRIDPVTIQNEEISENKLEVKIWYGLVCSDLADFIAENSFAHTFDGYKEMIYWLDERYDEYIEKVNRGEVPGRRTFIGDL